MNYIQTRENMSPSEPGHKIETNARMQRMLLVLKKALDVSVSQASALNVRQFFEEECTDEPELLQQLFAPAWDVDETSSQKQVAGELNAQTLHSMRRKIEQRFLALCNEHQLEQQLSQMEKTIQQAQYLSVQQVASTQVASVQSPNTDQQLKEQTLNNPSNTPVLSEPPTLVVQQQRVLAMEAEKFRLQAHLDHLREQKIKKEADVTAKRQAAFNTIDQLDHLRQQLDQATLLATDYGCLP